MMARVKQPGLLAIDIGTSSTRVTVFGKKEGIRDKWSVPEEVRARFSAEALWEKLSALIRQALQSCSDIHIEAIGISAFLGWVVVDDEGTPVDQAWSWMAQGDAAEINKYAPELSEETSQWIGRVVSDELGIFRWGKVIRNASQPTKVLSIKDYCIFKLTGAKKMDRTHASYTGLFSVQQREWEPRLLEAYNLPPDAVPSLGDGVDQAGMVSDEAASALGLPDKVIVALGGPDGTLAILGGGGTIPGKTVEVMGTTDVLFHITEYIGSEKLLSSGIVQNCHVIPGLYAVGGPTGMTGGTLTWLMKEWGWTFESKKYQQMLDTWNDRSPAGNGLFVIPSLTGARVPDWNPFMRGTIVGLQSSHTLADIYKATVEGISFCTKRIFDELTLFIEENDGFAAIGGGSKNEALLQTRAAVSGRNIQLPEEREASTIGAMALAGVLAGWFENIEAAVVQMNPIKQEIIVQKKEAANYESWYKEYVQLLTAMESWYRGLNREG